MNWASAILVYTVVWWLVLFCVLPIGIEPLGHEGAMDRATAGHDPGAPINPRLGRKLLITTAVAAAVFVVIYLIIVSDIISFRRMA